METAIWLSDTRYYKARVGIDLLGAPIVDLVWGSRHSQRGGGKTVAVATLQDALTLLDRIDRRRRRRGYAPLRGPL